MNQIDQIEPMIEEIELTPLAVRGELTSVDESAQKPASAPFYVRHGLFLITVILPLAIASIYFFLIESDRYISEARFIVRSAATTATGTGGLAAMIENQGLSRASDETYAVDDYFISRDIVALLARNDRLRQVLARPEADFINRFPNFYTGDNGENLYRRYQSMVSAKINSESGISKIEVTAFRPADARAINVAILKYAEQLINRLNDRAYDDAEGYAQSLVDREQAHVTDVETRLTDYRNTSGTVDPGKEAVASFELIGKMTTDLAMLQAQMQQQSFVAPNNPSLPAMREQIRSYQAQIDRQKIGVVGNNRSLATKLAGFEKLELERELAARSLGLAMVDLTKAREDARGQHLYLQMIVEPNIPDQPDYSGKAIGMLAVLLASLAAFTVIRGLGSLMLAHTA